MVGGGADWELQPSGNKDTAAVTLIPSFKLLKRDKMTSLTVLQFTFI